jgi:hypothetical protein
MSRHRQNAHLYELARRGAEVRLRELAQEAKNLVGLFPHLRDSFDSDELPISFILAKGAGRLTKANSKGPRRRQQMSAAAQKGVGERMKKYWAAKRTAKG